MDKTSSTFSKLLSLMSFCFVLATALNNAYGEPIPIKICHVNSNLDDELPSAQDLNMRYSGFELAVEDFNNNNNKFKAQFEVIKPRSSMVQVSSMISEASRLNCRGIVGLVASQDALLAAPALKQHELFAISSTAVADGLDSYFPHIISLANSISLWAKNILHFLSERTVRKLFIYQDPTHIFSQMLTKAINKAAESKEFDSLNIFNINSLSDLAFLTNNNLKSALVFTTYPLSSISTLRRLNTIDYAKGNNLIIGNPSWMADHTFKALKAMDVALPSFYVSNPWFNKYKNKNGVTFYNRYTQKYKKAPCHNVAYDYDATSFIIQHLSTQIQLNQSGSLQFRGITGNYNFLKNSHSNRKETIRLLSFNGNSDES